MEETGDFARIQLNLEPSPLLDGRLGNRHYSEHICPCGPMPSLYCMKDKTFGPDHRVVQERGCKWDCNYCVPKTDWSPWRLHIFICSNFYQNCFLSGDICFYWGCANFKGTSHSVQSCTSSCIFVIVIGRRLWTNTIFTTPISETNI